VQSSSYLQSQTVLRALEFALAKSGFDDPRQRKAALALVKDLKGNKSLGGRQQLLTSILKKGATVEDMVKATGSSRRTIFRYLNNFEEAGMDIQLEGGVYMLK